MISALPSSIDYLFSLEQFGIKLGLDNIRMLCKALDDPHKSFQSIVIAGTNGKGSVAAMVETALRSAGYITGRFTSPHLVALEERFTLAGRPVDRETLAEEADRLRTLITTLLRNGHLAAPPTFFEATTAIALSLFRRARVQAAVLEVGMGGRFDATNVVTPSAVVISSIDLDHQQFLGNTLTEIAGEKAGVIKPGTLVVIGETKRAAVEVLRQACKEQGGRLIEPATDVGTTVSLNAGLTELEMTTPVRRYGPIQLRLRGRHQVRNAMAAVRLLEELDQYGLPVSRQAILEALTNTRWRGRLELVPVGKSHFILLDAAHNVASVTAFAEYIEEVWPNGLPLVFATLRDKDVEGMVRSLGSCATGLICPRLTTDRALPPEILVAKARDARPNLNTTIAPSSQAAVEMAWGESNVIGVAGSIYLIGEVMADMALRP